MISRLPERLRQNGIVTHSSGNHAQAVSLAAQLFHVPAVVVMPTTALPIKIERARWYGAEVIFAGTTYEARRLRAEQIAKDRALTLIPPFDHSDILAGQGTIGLEILRDWPDVEAILVPVGGGGELSGIAAWVKRAKPKCRLVGVQPMRSSAMKQSFERGRIVRVESTLTIADGLRVECPGDLTFAHIRALADEMVVVGEEAIIEAAARLLREAKLIVEFSGATALAALISRDWRPEGRKTAVVLSGGNMEPAQLLELIGAASPLAAAPTV